jgi:hypothetical protein
MNSKGDEVEILVTSEEGEEHEHGEHGEHDEHAEGESGGCHYHAGVK